MCRLLNPGQVPSDAPFKLTVLFYVASLRAWATPPGSLRDVFVPPSRTIEHGHVDEGVPSIRSFVVAVRVFYPHLFTGRIHNIC